VETLATPPPFAALPLAISLWDRGVEVHLANLSFTPLELLPLDAWAAEHVAEVTPGTDGRPSTRIAHFATR
jgi:hypothetical protein